MVTLQFKFLLELSEKSIGDLFSLIFFACLKPTLAKRNALKIRLELTFLLPQPCAQYILGLQTHRHVESREDPAWYKARGVLHSLYYVQQTILCARVNWIKQRCRILDNLTNK